MGPKEIRPDDCRVLLTSPGEYEECVVEVETEEELLFVLSDEHRTGFCVIELPGDGEIIARKLPLAAFRALLDAAERKLVGPE